MNSFCLFFLDGGDAQPAQQDSIILYMCLHTALSSSYCYVCVRITHELVDAKSMLQDTRDAGAS